MSETEKKGLTVKIDADLHAEVRQYLDAHEMTMAEFVAMALEDELHPKNIMKEGTTMEKTRTLAFQIPEELYLRIKDYLQRNNLTQRQFVIGLIEDELRREQDELEAQSEDVSDEDEVEDEDTAEEEETDISGGFEDESDTFDEETDEAEDEEQGFGMTM